MNTQFPRDDVPATIDTLLSEGPQPLLVAAREAKVHVPYHSLVRAALTGKLATLKVAGRRQTTAAEVRRWIERCSRLPDRAPSLRTRRSRQTRARTSPEARRYLASRGLPCGKEQDR